MSERYKCTRCRRYRPIGDYRYRTNDRGYRYREGCCMKCKKRLDAKRYQCDKITIDARSAAWKAAHPEQARRNWQAWYPVYAIRRKLLVLERTMKDHGL